MFKKAINEVNVVDLKFDLLMKIAAMEPEIQEVIKRLKTSTSFPQESHAEYKSLAYATFLKHAKSNSSSKFASGIGMIEYLLPNHITLNEAKIIFDECLKDIKVYTTRSSP